MSTSRRPRPAPQPPPTSGGGLLPWLGLLVAGIALLVALRPRSPEPPPPAPTPVPEPTHAASVSVPPARAAAPAPKSPPVPPAAEPMPVPDPLQQQSDAERRAIDSAIRAALASLRPEPLVEQHNKLAFNTVSGCQSPQVIGRPEASRPEFRVGWQCTVIPDGVHPEQRWLEIPGRVEKRDGRWVASFD